MIAGGRDLIVVAPWVAIAPGLALVATVLACTLLGDALRDRLAGEAGSTLRDGPERSSANENRQKTANGIKTNSNGVRPHLGPFRRPNFDETLEARSAKRA